MALEARRRRRRRTASPVRRRRRSVTAKTTHRRRRRRSSLRENVLGARGGITSLAMNFLEAGAGSIAAGIVGKMLPIQNPMIKTAAGLGLSVITATQLKRPTLAAGMAATFASDFIRSLKIIPGLAEMEQAEFVEVGELEQPNMIYVSPEGEPVFLSEGGRMVYSDGTDSGLSYYDYE